MDKKPRKKMGRPPKPLDEKQGERATVWMTRKERAEVERDAAKAGMSVSAYLLRLWKERR